MQRESATRGLENPGAVEGWYDAVFFHDYYGGQGFALEAGRDYAIAFEAKVEPAGMVTVNLPEWASVVDASSASETPCSKRTKLGEGYRRLRFTFSYDPALNDGEVSFFVGRRALSQGGRYLFRRFQLRCLD